MSAIFWITFWI